MKWNTLIFSGLSLLLSVVLFSCGSQSKTSEAPTAYPPVSATRISIGEVYDEQTYNAYSQYLTKENVRAPISGYLEKVAAHIGETVVKGQLLFSMRTQEAIALANTRLETDSIMNFDVSINVYAPRDGVINSVAYQQAAFVLQGDQLANLIPTSSIVFILNVPFENAGAIHNGMPVKIDLPGNKTIPATVGDQLPLSTAAAQVQSYVLEPATALFIPENLKGTVHVKIAQKAEVQRIPKSAVLSNETQTKFWVMKMISDTIAVRVNIKKGLEIDSLVEIVSPAFDKQTRILLTGQYGLADTARVALQRKNIE